MMMIYLTYNADDDESACISQVFERVLNLLEDGCTGLISDLDESIV